jgi:hypothetical protein
MRIYVLVTSIKPLEAFIYNEGFARMSTQSYNLNTKDLANNMIHLTNYSIQKGHFEITDDNFLGGSKITLRMLRDQLQARNISWENIWSQVQEICLKALVACQTDIPANPNSFEIFGYDIIIDSNL